MDIVAKLHPLERIVLPVLKDHKELKAIIKTTGCSEVEVMRALQWLENKKLLKIDKEEFQKRGAGIIHWLPVDKVVNVEVSMPDGKVVKGFGEQGLSKLKLGSVVQFERFGFVKLDSKEKDKLKFWFTHK